MKKLLPFLFSFFLLSLTPLPAQEMLNVTLFGSWDTDTLPTHSFGTFNDIWGYAAKGREYIFMGSAAYIHIFDVTDPSNIVLIDEIPGGDQTVWRDMKTYQDRLYAVSDGTLEGLIIIDLSDLPNSVSKTYHSNEFFGNSHNIFIDQSTGRLYTSNHPMQVLDLTQDLDKPTLLASLSLPAGGGPHDLTVKNNAGFLSSGFDGLFIYDFTNLDNPLLVASQVTNGYNHSNWPSEDGSFLIVAEEIALGLPLLTIDLSNLASGEVEIMKEFKFPLLAPDHLDATPHNPYILGDYAYVSYYEDGVQIFDVSDPTNPTRAAYIDTYPQNVQYNGYAGCWGVYPFLPSGNIFASDMDNGLFSFEANLPTTGVKHPKLDIDYLAVFPNPAEDVLTLELHNARQSEVQITLTDMIGKALISQPFSWQGEAKHSLDISPFAKGMYVLSIQNETGISSKKIVKR